MLRSGAQRGARTVSFVLLVLGVPFASWATAVAVSFCFFFSRRSFSLLFGSLTATDLAAPAGIENVALAPSMPTVPAHRPAVPAGQLSFSFSAPFFDARNLPVPI